MGTIKTTSNKDKHKKAIKITLIAALICIIPFYFLYYVSSNYGGSEHTKDLESPSFLMPEQNGGYFTNHSLIGKVTLLVYLPSNCADCQGFLEGVIETYNWSKEALKKLEYFEESDVELQRALINDSPAIQTTLEGWLELSESSEAKKDLLAISNICQIPFEASAIIFDRAGRIKACVPYKSFKFSDIKRILSKVMFNSSMDEYLSERTFFGPRKKTISDYENGN